METDQVIKYSEAGQSYSFMEQNLLGFFFFAYLQL